MSYQNYKKHKNQIKSRHFTFRFRFYFLYLWNLKHSHINKNQPVIQYKIVVTALLLVLAVTFSLIELPSIYLPWGAEFDYRLFDTFVLFLAIRAVGVLWATLDALLLPWLHVMIDGHHTAIAMLGFMLNDIACVWCFWLFYYQIFSLSYQPLQGEKKQKFIVKKILATAIISPLCAAFESCSYLLVFFLSVAGFKQNPNMLSSSRSIFVYFSNAKDLLFLFLFFFGAFLIKYVVELLIFFSLEKRCCKIANHFQQFTC